MQRRSLWERRDSAQLDQYLKQAQEARGAPFGSIAQANDPNQYGSVASNQFPQFFGSRPAQPQALSNNGGGMARRFDAAAAQQSIADAMGADTAFRNRVPQQQQTPLTDPVPYDPTNNTLSIAPGSAKMKRRGMIGSTPALPAPSTGAWGNDDGQ